MSPAPDEQAREEEKRIGQHLHPRLVAALRKKGWDSLTEPQRVAFWPIEEGKNILLIAPTGMGKTESAIIPLLDALLKKPSKGISLLYITPLRALNRDMLARLSYFGQELGLGIAVRHGDTPQKERNRQSRKAPDVLITTPETVQIMFTGKRLREHLKQVRWVVVDETHELAQDERGAQLSLALERLCAFKGGEFQRIGLSATVGSPHEVARFLAGTDRPVEVLKVSVSKDLELLVTAPQLSGEDKHLPGLLHAEEKQAAAISKARRLMVGHRSVLFFVNTRYTAEGLGARFHIWEKAEGGKHEFPAVGVHHGSLSKAVRVQMEDDFKAQRLQTLICTSSLELGIDIGSADLTLQFNSPREVARLLQRAGRAGHRVGETSKAVVLSLGPDDIFEGAVIARRALGEELEPVVVRECPLDVLANQVAAQANAFREVDAGEFYKVVKRAYPFRHLERTDYDLVLEQLHQERVAWVEDGKIGKKKGSMTYFYDNISMIPDEKNYKVTDITTRTAIGTLDEGFVLNWSEPFAKVIIKGRPWRIVDLGEDEITVEPTSDVGAIPTWVGEEIPVPFDVAQEVGRLRCEENFEEYPMDGLAKEEAAAHLAAQKEKGVVPTDTLVTIEYGGDAMVINACFGDKVNAALGQMMSSLLAARVGESIGLRTDAYRIILSLPMRTKPQLIKDFLENTDPGALEGLLKMVLRNSGTLRWEMLYVGRKFGAFRKDMDWKRINIKKLMDVFEGTPLYEETLNKVLWQRMDVPKARGVLEAIRDGMIQVKITGPTPIGNEGLREFRELMSPARADRSILMALKGRLEDTRMKLVCTSCKRSWTRRVAGLPEKISCQICGAKMVGAVGTRQDTTVLKAKDPTAAQKKRIRAIYKTAALVLASGRRAVLVLAGRGIGPDAAGRILEYQNLDEDELLRKILEAEIKYARTKRFWD